MSAWRLLKLETHDAFMNMAIDEAILASRIENRVPNTVRFYLWNPSAVSIGKFQNVENEVQLENCRKLGVDVVRRITGGGTVYHDAEDEITYSVIVSKKDLGTEDVVEVYAEIYQGLVEALGILGVTADFNEGNVKACPNLTVGGKKISGSAQCHKKGVVLQHGTLLLDVDLKKMFTLLQVPWAKTCMKVVDVAKNKITSMREQLGRKISLNEAETALKKGFGKAFNIELGEDELKPFESELARELCEKKYSTEDWNLCKREE
jgi:lipoate-protein ligase A